MLSAPGQTGLRNGDQCPDKTEIHRDGAISTRDTHDVTPAFDN